MYWHLAETLRPRQRFDRPFNLYRSYDMILCYPLALRIAAPVSIARLCGIALSLIISDTTPVSYVTLGIPTLNAFPKGITGWLPSSVF